MGKSNNKVTNITVGLAIVIGVAINNFLSQYSGISSIINWIITFLVSASIYDFLFWLLTELVNHFEFLLKLYWGNKYIKGYWTYTYIVNGVKKYGAWCIDQDIESVTIKGFGITPEGIKRSDVQSLTSLISRGNDYEIVNMRRDISQTGEMPDMFYYSKTILHLEQRNTFLNLFNYPLKMDGTTYIYGGALSGNIHQQLKFTKYREAKSEQDIIDIVKFQITGT